MIYDIGVSDIDRVPEELRSGNAWRIWFPEEPSASLDYHPEWDWIRQNSYQLLGNRNWPNYWLHQTARNNQCQPSSETPSSYFSVLVRKPRPHRVRIMQGLQDKGLLAYGVYSWLDHKPDWWKFEQPSPGPKIQQLDYMQREEDMWKPPAEVFNSAISLSLETYDDRLFITEKTYIPIHNTRLVLPYGAPGTIAQLRLWGFEFPDFFDFGYDQPLPATQRESAYVKTVQKIIKLGPPQKLYRLCLPYAQNNRKVFDRLIIDRVGMPKFKNVPDWATQLHTFIDSLV